MKAPNYCRDLLKQFRDDPFRPEFDGVVSGIKQLIKESQKIVLPDGGSLYEDLHLKALDETQELHLPFETIAVEYTRSAEFIKTTKSIELQPSGELQPSKALFFAKQTDTDILVRIMVHDEGGANKRPKWVPYPPVRMPRIGYLDRRLTSSEGHVRIVAYGITDIGLGISVPPTDYEEELSNLLSMLNVLNCSNISLEKIPKSKVKTAAISGKKNAIPYDDYYTLAVEVPKLNDSRIETKGGQHQSPREHIRRGHIRKLHSGRKIWVNASVVNAGKTEGKIEKAYAFSV